MSNDVSELSQSLSIDADGVLKLVNNNVDEALVLLKALQLHRGSLLEDKQEDGVAYVQPSYVELKLSKDKKLECRTVVKNINQLGLSQRQKMFLIYLLGLELENRELMLAVTKAIGLHQADVVDLDKGGDNDTPQVRRPQLILPK